jgi:hypothetical protein
VEGREEEANFADEFLRPEARQQDRKSYVSEQRRLQCEESSVKLDVRAYSVDNHRIRKSAGQGQISESVAGMKQICPTTTRTHTHDRG